MSAEGPDQQSPSEGCAPAGSLGAALDRALRWMEDIRGVDGALIAGRDGLLVAASAPPSTQLETEAALAAAIFGAVDRASNAMVTGPVRATLVETASHSMQLLGFADLILVVFANKKADISCVRAGMAKAAATLARQASQPEGIVR